MEQMPECVLGGVLDATQTRILTMETAVESPAVELATAGLSVEARTTVAGLSVGCEVSPAEGGGPEDTVISVEVQSFEGGRRCLGADSY